MSDKKLNFDLEDELNLLYAELEENDELYNQIKSHYDRLMKTTNPGILRSVVDQTANILRIRSDRLGIIKELINAKKVSAEMDLKEMSIGGNENDDSKMSQLAQELYSIMQSKPKEGAISNLLKSANPTDEEEKNIEVQTKENNDLDARMKKIKEKKDKEKKEKEFKERGYILVADMANNKIVALTEDGSELLEGVEIPNLKLEFYTDDLTGEILAKTELGDILPVINIK